MSPAAAPAWLPVCPQTPLAMWQRIKEGRDLLTKVVLPNWKPWNPPKLGQALQQVGTDVTSSWTLEVCGARVATRVHELMYIPCRRHLPVWGPKETSIYAFLSCVTC
jgi:hypothetical protein